MDKLLHRIINLSVYLMLLGILGIGSVNAQTSKLASAQLNLDKAGLVLEGYDVVSYFFGTPQKGKPEIQFEEEGVLYWFSSDENKQLFIKNPVKFQPAYGGWCAYAMGATGEKVKIDPKTYKIIDGKLYLFYNFYFNNTLIDWNKDEVNLKTQADLKWQMYLEQ